MPEHYICDYLGLAEVGVSRHGLELPGLQRAHGEDGAAREEGLAAAGAVHHAGEVGHCKQRGLGGVGAFSEYCVFTRTVNESLGSCTDTTQGPEKAPNKNKTFWTFSLHYGKWVFSYGK